VAEQGLDIIDCDLVIFYDCVPDQIRVHQRRNQTGKQKKGRLVILITKGTADERYYWVAKESERKQKIDIQFD
jgi:ERCC4-related helicase